MADIWKLLATPVKTPTETLVAGTVDFYNPGTTGESNRKDVYTDAAGTIVAANPYTLDSDAIAVLYGTGTYHVVIKDSSGNTEYDLDYITPDKEIYAFTPATLAELQAITGYAGATANLLGRTTLGLGGGQFYWDSSDLSTEVTADTLSGVYVAPDSDATGASGAWVRDYNGQALADWFGAVGDSATDDTDAIQAALALTGYVYLDPSKTYYIAGGSNSVDSGVTGDSVPDGIRVPSNTVFDLNGATLTSDVGGATASDANQFRIITNDLSGATSENFSILGPGRLVFTGTEGYYCNGIWINGGVTSNPEHFVNNFEIATGGKIIFEGMRVGVILRDNMPTAAPIATNDVRRIGNGKIGTVVGIDCVSAVVAPDADDIQIDSIFGDASGVSGDSFDCFSLVRGHRIQVNQIRSVGLNAGYTALIRNRTGSNTSDIQIGRIYSNGGKGVAITTDSGASGGEITEQIQIGQVIIDDGALVIGPSDSDADVKDVTIGEAIVSGGTTIDSLNVGARIFTGSSAGTYPENIRIGSLKIKDISTADIIAFNTSFATDVHIGHLDIKRDDNLAAAWKILGNVTGLHVPSGKIVGGDVGIDMFSASANIDALLQGIDISGSLVAVDTDGSENGDTVRMLDMTYERLTGAITAFADAGGGQVTVTSAGHGLTDGQITVISGTTNYQGTFTIANSTTDTFEITDTWVADDATGTWVVYPINNFQVFPGSSIDLQRGLGQNTTIVGGVATVTNEWHKFDTEGGAASDDLNTINGGHAGNTLLLSIVNNGRNVVIKHAADNIRTKSAGDVTLDTTNDRINLQFDGSNWVEI